MIDASLAFAPAIALVMTVLVAAVCICLGLACRVCRVLAVLTAGTWVGGQLLAPIGPLLWDVPWLSYVIAGITMASLHLAFQAVSGYMSIVIADQLDSLANARRSIRASLTPRIGRVFGKSRQTHPAKPLFQGTWE